MRILYVYNPNNVNEAALLERAKTELSTYVTEVIIEDFMVAKDIYPISATPALIIIREDFQGDNLLTEDPINAGKLLLASLAYKAMQEEDEVVHNMQVNRLDNVINAEVQARMGENLQVMNDMAALLSENGVV